MKNGWNALYALFAFITAIGITLSEGGSVAGAMVFTGVVALIVTFISHMISLASDD